MRNLGEPVHHVEEYSTDLISEKALGFIDEAVQNTRPFFLGLSPIGPHSDIHFTGVDDENGFEEVITSAPPAAKRHEGLFEDAVVPRTPHFNPDTVSDPIYDTYILPVTTIKLIMVSESLPVFVGFGTSPSSTRVKWKPTITTIDSG